MPERDAPTFYGFLKEVDDSTLRQWHEFTESNLYNFLVNRLRKLQNSAMKRCFYSAKSMEDVFLARGESNGLLEFERFFEKVKHERTQRINRAAHEGTDHPPG